jgi:hypothetical protein
VDLRLLGGSGAEAEVAAAGVMPVQFQQNSDETSCFGKRCARGRTGVEMRMRRLPGKGRQGLEQDAMGAAAPTPARGGGGSAEGAEVLVGAVGSG